MSNMKSTLPFLDKKAFITGSSRGIGKAIALDLASKGADILLHYRRDEAAATETANEVKKLGRKVWIYQGDMSIAAEREALLDKLIEDHTTLDIYIANAASTAFKPLSDLEDKHIDRTLQLVVNGFIMTVKKLQKIMSHRSAHIVAISGIDTYKTFPGHGLLAAAKGALEVLVKYFATELAPLDIHVNAINPGLVATDSLLFYMGDSFNHLANAANQLAPTGKGMGKVEDVAKIVSFLCSDDSNWMAGQTIYAEGGISAMIGIS